MNLAEDLSDFNHRLANELRGTFAPDVKPFQSPDGELFFRGPVEGHINPKHIGTHVAVLLTKEVVDALGAAAPSQRDEWEGHLLNNLATQVKMRYAPGKVGPYALKFVGTMDILRG